jgi:pimeloyl-ACP methyl ester carboxylesterase
MKNIYTMKKFICILIFLAGPSLGYSQNLNANLDQWYLWTEDNTRLFVAEGGQGDSVIVIHGGWGAEHSYLVPALEPLFDQFHLTFYDQRGSLRSPAPDSTISLQQFVSDLEQLRQELGISKVTLLSHSMGSFLAYAYLKEHPEHVKGLALLSPVLPTGVSREKKKTADRKFVEFAKANEKQELKEEGLLDKQGLSAKEETAKWKIGYASGNIYHINRWKQLKGGQAFYNPDIATLINENTTKGLMDNFLQTLESHSVPMYVIIGDHDLVDFGLSTWPDVAADIPHMDLLKLKNAGHNSWIDKPGKFNDYVEKALQQITQ